MPPSSRTRRRPILHIPPHFEAADVLAALEAKDRRIAELEAELATLR